MSEQLEKDFIKYQTQIDNLTAQRDKAINDTNILNEVISQTRGILGYIKKALTPEEPKDDQQEDS